MKFIAGIRVLYYGPGVSETRQPVRKILSRLYLRDGNEKCGRISQRNQKEFVRYFPELNAASLLT